MKRENGKWHVKVNGKWVECESIRDCILVSFENSFDRQEGDK